MRQATDDLTRRTAGFATSTALLLLTAQAAWAAPVSGNLLDGVTLEPVVQATIDAGDGRTAVTDRAGYFRFDDLPAGSYQLNITAKGYEPGLESLDVATDALEGVTLIVYKPGEAAEVVEIEGEQPLPPPPGRQDIRREEITRIPGARGDALQSLRSLPGVAATNNNGGGLLVIRGAAPEDSRITIDGIDIPVINHFFGLQSILPSEFIANIEYLPGGFGVDEGRATGGMINVITRDEPANKVTGFAELSFINLAALLRAPISTRHNISMTAAVRRSAIDFILPLVLDGSDVSFTTAPTYYDAQLRVDWRPRAHHRLSLLGLTSFDQLELFNDSLDPNDPAVSGTTFKNRTAFSRLIATWAYGKEGVDNRLVAALGTTGFGFEIGTNILDINQTTIEVRDDFGAKVGRQLKLRAGSNVRLETRDLNVRFPAAPQEGEPPPTSFGTLPLVEYRDTLRDDIVGAYAAADWRPSPALTISAGLRGDYYSHISAFELAPRVQATAKISPITELRGSLGLYSRNLDQAESVPTNLEPERATQAVLGIEQALTDGVTFTASAFYTDRSQLVVRDPLLSQTDPLNAYVNLGTGRSFGGEFLLRVRKNNFFGWVAYTLTRSDRVDRPGQDRRLFDSDQPLNIVAVGSYKYGKWEFGGRFQFATGTPETPIMGSTYVADINAFLPNYGGVNSRRIEDAHALDLRIDRRWAWGAVKMSAYLDVTNVYAHARVLGYSYNYDFSEREAITELPILPSLGLRGEL